MKVTTAFAVAVLLLGTASARAGPCSNAIAQFEQAVRQSGKNPTAGPTGSQTVSRREPGSTIPDVSGSTVQTRAPSILQTG
jgi:hypothetical protein